MIPMQKNSANPDEAQAAIVKKQVQRQMMEVFMEVLRSLPEQRRDLQNNEDLILKHMYGIICRTTFYK